MARTHPSLPWRLLLCLSVIGIGSMLAAAAKAPEAEEMEDVISSSAHHSGQDVPRSKGSGGGDNDSWLVSSSGDDESARQKKKGKYDAQRYTYASEQVRSLLLEIIFCILFFS